MDVSLYTATQLPDFIRKRYTLFLEHCGLRDENDTDFTALYQNQDGEILACGSLRGNVLKQIAVSPEAEGKGLCAGLVSELIHEAVNRGERHLFLYTKPVHQKMFMDLGFYPVVSTTDMLMMENHRNGLKSFLASLPHPAGRVGAVVCNCNPFTLGHRHLIEYAAAHCENLIVFILSEDLSMIPVEDRYELVKAGTDDLKNVQVVYSQDYLISRATFPTYFIKEHSRCADTACELDITLFASRIAPELNISVRFVGEEPFDIVTRGYNEMMKQMLPAYHIQLIEIPRYRGISASKIRKLLSEGRLRETKEYLPETTYEYCVRNFRTGT